MLHTRVNFKKFNPFSTFCFWEPDHFVDGVAALSGVDSIESVLEHEEFNDSKFVFHTVDQMHVAF